MAGSSMTELYETRFACIHKNRPQNNSDSNMSRSLNQLLLKVKEHLNTYHTSEAIQYRAALLS